MSAFESAGSSGRVVQKQQEALNRLKYTHPEPVIHQDSGRRFHQGEDVTEVPPGYSAD
jgi:hypothetical protein